MATVVCVRDKDMAEAWCLAASDPAASAATRGGYYARRGEIEPSFRDSKNLRFGMGLGRARVKEPERRDRLWL
ncbi:IS4 family transposase, partial [Citrobacter sp. AAK_AS5]